MADPTAKVPVVQVRRHHYARRYAKKMQIGVVKQPRCMLYLRVYGESLGRAATEESADIQLTLNASIPSSWLVMIKSYLLYLVP